MVRKKYSPEFKVRAVLEVLKGEKTAAQLAGELQVHPIQLSEWKKQFLEYSPQVFEKTKRKVGASYEEKQKSALFEQIGRLKMENEWLKKKLGTLG